jgi:hypothetical protein
MQRSNKKFDREYGAISVVLVAAIYLMLDLLIANYGLVVFTLVTLLLIGVLLLVTMLGWGGRSSKSLQFVLAATIAWSFMLLLEERGASLWTRSLGFALTFSLTLWMLSVDYRRLLHIFRRRRPNG